MKLALATLVLAAISIAIAAPAPALAPDAELDKRCSSMYPAYLRYRASPVMTVVFMDIC